ncbi:HAD-IA family hydrolase [Maritalea sp.]|uniref:HAD-IA family hydrolase n=1 Tax=Maritalea sp. TaxID=2003361 RepID=UPI003EF3EB50
MRQQPTIVFDLDGTLADTLSDLVAALNRTLALHKVKSVEATQVGFMTGRGGLRAMIMHAIQQAGMPINQELIEELFIESIIDYQQNMSVETALYPGVNDSLQRFSDKGWLLGVCTNKPIELAEKLLLELEIDQLFSAVTGVGSFKFKKPDPRHLIRTVELAGGNCSKAIMVGDTQNDILTAQRANIPVIAVDFGYSEHPIQTYGPDHVISNFENLFCVADKLIG